ncbi:MAG: hypothetical protein WC586_08985 [Methanoregula sp.]
MTGTISGNERPVVGDGAGVINNNPWFLINGDEIKEIETQLQYFRNDLSGPIIATVQNVDNLLRTVRDRRP